MKKIFSTMMVVVILGALLTACGGNTSSDTITFWTAPNNQQLAFWTKMAESYNATNPTLKIEVQQMPESPSSEAGIQNAIASGEAPVASENIQRGFAAQLADSEAILDLSNNAQFKALVEQRNMSDVIKGWEIDGKQYVVPLFSNPVLNMWRVDMLKELGINEMPTTYDEVYAIADKIAASGQDKFALYDYKISRPADWWERWFDFMNYYEAASEGKAFIEGNTLVADDAAAIDALTLIATLGQKSNGLLTVETPDAAESGVTAGFATGPWALPNIKEKFPDLKAGVNYDFTMPPTKDGAGQYTFADTKGIVFYQGASDEQISGMMDFLAFTLTEQNDLDFLKMTDLIPARDDLSTNATFQSYFDENPINKKFAEQVPNAIPAMSNPNMATIQEVIGTHMQKMVTENISPADTWNAIKAELATTLAE
ncbi:sugar ABC transporter substrate-binding protein [Culicoidibacter larvae]|uniref:Carbohydrate ABC transporter substrate-binding protein n=1 Tax=Culicoidibacter larvae TaxID=2579976 RepID=A0A5R8QAI1_9FIRM|nr:ABC transporter substrate-binding protein [Culicoidibacter larvae]TLG72934.1 carbohydrate ABC transporter substrate-binding protein [Culicoidibacter larvae]